MEPNAYSSSVLNEARAELRIVFGVSLTCLVLGSALLGYGLIGRWLATYESDYIYPTLAIFPALVLLIGAGTISHRILRVRRTANFAAHAGQPRPVINGWYLFRKNVHALHQDERALVALKRKTEVTILLRALVLVLFAALYVLAR